MIYKNYSSVVSKMLSYKLVYHHPPTKRTLAVQATAILRYISLFLEPIAPAISMEVISPAVSSISPAARYPWSRDTLELVLYISNESR